jgi:hypothetical protein
MKDNNAAGRSDKREFKEKQKAQAVEQPDTGVLPAVQARPSGR